MHRALRIFALAGLLALIVFMGFEYAFTVAIFPPFVSLVPEFLRDAFKTTGFALTFTSGVVAVVACLPRRQYRWAIVLVGLLVLTTYGLFFAVLLLNGTAGLHIGSPPIPALLLDPNVVQYIPALLLALFVLIYSFQRPRASRVSVAAGATPSASTSRHTHGS
jgi:hypothetical protein